VGGSSARWVLSYRERKKERKREEKEERERGEEKVKRKSISTTLIMYDGITVGVGRYGTGNYSECRMK